MAEDAEEVGKEQGEVDQRRECGFWGLGSCSEGGSGRKKLWWVEEEEDRWDIRQGREDEGKVGEAEAEHYCVLCCV